MSAAVHATKNYVVIERSAATAISRRLRKLETLVREMHRERETNRTLLDTALLELARAEGAKDRRLYARRWLRERRTIDEQGVTIVHAAATTSGGDA
jgi:hypothetical protein